MTYIQVSNNNYKLVDEIEIVFQKISYLEQTKLLLYLH